MIRAVAFDLDDTLYDEAQFLEGGISAVAEYVSAEYGANRAQVRWMLRAVQKVSGREAMLSDIIRLFDLPSGCLPDLVRVYRTHTPRLTLFPGYQELLTMLRKRFRLAVLTDGLVEVQERKILALGLNAVMNPIIFGWQEGSEFGKPSPRPFVRLLEALDLNPDEVIYVGDNPYKDFAGAAKVRIQTVRVLTGTHRLVDSRPDATPAYTVPDLKGLPWLLHRELADGGSPEYATTSRRSHVGN